MTSNGLTRTVRQVPRHWWVAMLGVVALAVLVGALMPQNVHQKDAIPHLDKAQHAVAFGLLTWMALKVWPERLIWVAVGVLAFGALIEGLQGALTTTRSASWSDWFADLAGVLLVVLWTAFARRSRHT